jgi:hypothetical protein
VSRATMPNQLWISSIWTDMKPRTLPTLDAAELPESLRPGITAAAGDSERQGDIPTGLRDALRDAGAFRLLTPRELGGWEAPLTTVLDIYERFGHIDASVGLLVWNANFGFVGAMLDPAGSPRSGETEPSRCSRTPVNRALPNPSMAGIAYRESGKSSAASTVPTG